MLRRQAYLHVIDGRLRIKIFQIRNSPEKASKLQLQVRAIAGIKDAFANPLTGNLLVLFEPNRVSHERIINRLTRMGYVQNSPPPAQPSLHGHNALAELLLNVAMQALVEKLVLALV